MTSFAASNVMEVLNAFNSKKVQYAICRDIDNALPENYAGEADIDLVIHPEDWKLAQGVLTQQNWFEVLHPFDNLTDFVFLYGVKRFRFFVRGSAKLDICFQLTCRSTNAGEWIPLDQEIQDSVWANRKWDDLRLCYTLSPIDEIVHLLARAYYDKKGFTEAYRLRIQELFLGIDESDLEHRLRLVFFRAAAEVMLCMRTGEIGEIVARVNAFHDY